MARKNRGQVAPDARGAYALGGAEPLYKDPEPTKTKKGGKLRLFFRVVMVLFVVGFVGALGVGLYAWNYVRGLEIPDHEVLASYEPKVTTRVYAGDGTLAAEYARERRLFVPAESIPDVVKQAYMSAEDKNFYEHSGVDLVAFIKAQVQNVPRVMRGQRVAGASTITQQVAKNFLLTSDRKVERKVKEALIARRMERAFTKEQIFELYLNEIYLGNRSYGVAAASLNYFGKPLSEIEPHEAAYMAALAKAPSNYHPVRRTERALGRRNWILGQMGENGYLTEAEVAEYRAMPLGAELSPPLGARSADSEYFAEAVRRRIASGEVVEAEDGVSLLYDGGLAVRTTLNPALQDYAQRAFKEGLEAYDRRHGWRGPLSTLDLPGDLSARVDDPEAGDDAPLVWQAALRTEAEALREARKTADDLAPWEVALVLSVANDAATIGLQDGLTATLPISDLQTCASCVEEDDHWARRYAGADSRERAKITKVSQVLSPGDVVHVQATEGRSLAERAAAATTGTDDASAPADATPLTVSLKQVPAVNGGLIAVDPHTGRVLAMVGGYSFGLSEFNRSIQAWRQPGSTFKPFVYAAALESGYTPSSIVLDAPFVAPGFNGEWWKPSNYAAGRFYGESTLRLGIEKSRNTMTARLAQDLGVGRIIDVAQRFGVSDQLPRELAISLGAGETTLMRLTTAYAQFVNGGRRIEPVLIDRVQDRYGETVYTNDQRPCFECDAEAWDAQSQPVIPDERGQVIDPRTAYQMVSILEGVIDRGTGSRVNEYVDPAIPLAGKTGTTDEYRDAWFVGFHPDLAVGIYVGFDTPATMGQGEGGGIVAAPIFGRFMQQALANETVVPFRAPSGIRMVRVNAKTGRPADPGDPNVILEAFKAEDDVTGDRRFTQDAGRGDVGRGQEGITDDLGGIY